MTLIKGADVASFQAVEFDTTGLSFAFTKATQSTNYVNSRMSGQAAWMRRKGLVVGFYHFLVKGNIYAQAAYFVKQAASIDGDILACDWETNPANSTYPSNAEKDAFIKEVKRLRPTHKVVLYCNTSFWKSIDKTSYAGDGLWIADPNHASGKPAVQAPWIIHQYSISGGMDRNVANFTTKAALADWAGAGNGYDVALDPADINKIADAVYTKLLKTDGVLAGPADAADIKTNPFWTWQSHITSTDDAARKSASNSDAILALLKDPTGFIAELKAEIGKIAMTVKVDE